MPATMVALLSCAAPDGLGTLGGKEYFDAVILLGAAEAVFIRTKQ